MASVDDSKLYWTQMEELFHGAMRIPKLERADWLRDRCNGDAQLFKEVLEMLASHSSVQELLVEAPELQHDGLQRRQSLAGTESDPWLGRILGPFQLQRMLGRGGMGVVYLASRVSGGFKQSAAIKVVARNLSSGPAVQQFCRERDVLARMAHRNVARLLDAGTIDGMPFIAMEYIEGRRFDEVCDDPSFSLDAKLRLFLQLCDGVSYVHRNLILHRDLKPENVLVSVDGLVKLLDFGTIKLLGPTAELPSEMTQAGMRPLTLRYASPEHILGKSVSTATDVYSLGMILYRLLAGRLPEVVSARSAEEYVAHQREATPEPPSKLWRHDKMAVSASLHDIDAIVAKALRFEPVQRYASVDALATDLNLCLQRRPVAARRGSTRYHLVRFLQRNRLAVLGTATVLVVLLFGLVTMRHESRLAMQEHAKAQAGIEEERKLAHVLLFDYFQALADIQGSTDAQRQAATQAVAYLDQLSSVTHDPALELDTVQAYQKMGLLLGSPYVANLGDAPAAIQTLQKATVLSRKLLALDPQNLDYRVAFVDVQKAMAQAYFAMKQPERSLEILLPAADMARAIAKDPHATGKMLNQCAAVLKTLADTYGQHANGATQNFDKAVSTLEESGVMYQASVDRGSGLYSGPVVAYTFLANLLRSEDVDRAAEMFKKALGIIASLPASERNKVSIVRLDQTCRTKLGAIYRSLGDEQQANALFESIHAPILRAIAADPIDTRARDDLMALDTSILNAAPLTNSKETLAVMREYLQTTEFLVRTHPQQHEWQFVHAEALLNYAKLYTDLGDQLAAEPYIEKGLPEILAIAAQPDADAETLGLAANALVFSKRDPDHGPALAVAFAQRAIDDTHPPTADQLITLASAQQAQNQFEAAKASTHAAMALLADHPKSLGNAANVAQARALLRGLSASTR